MRHGAEWQELKEHSKPGGQAVAAAAHRRVNLSDVAAVSGHAPPMALSPRASHLIERHTSKRCVCADM